jgi:hypothetical protein
MDWILNQLPVHIFPSSVFSTFLLLYFDLFPSFFQYILKMGNEERLTENGKEKRLLVRVENMALRRVSWKGI